LRREHPLDYHHTVPAFEEGAQGLREFNECLDHQIESFELVPACDRVIAFIRLMRRKIIVI